MKTKLVGLLALALGCSQTWDWDAPPIVTITSAKVEQERNEAAPAAMRDIAEATCDHERSCLKVGPNNQWSSYDACVQTTHAKLAYTSCSTSVSQTRLSSCIDDIRADPCVSTRASTMRVTSCTPEELCSPE
jgi:hypothetical protein